MPGLPLTQHAGLIRPPKSGRARAGRPVGGTEGQSVMRERKTTDRAGLRGQCKRETRAGQGLNDRGRIADGEASLDLKKKKKTVDGR